jgi:SAM-dependent methyltransferase
LAILQNVFEYNRRLSRFCTPKYVQDANAFGFYGKIGTMLLSHPRVTRVLDCGAGKRWHFPSHYKIWYGIDLVGLDIDAAEMVDNKDLNSWVECDVTKEIPVEPNSVDLIMAYSGIEHFNDNEAFLKQAYSALRPGGFLLAQFPSRFAPFAIVNRLLPKRAAAKLLNWSMREYADRLGFSAHYDRTNYTAFFKLVKSIGFDELYYYPGYYSSTYAEFLFPVWIASYSYDILRFALGFKNIASYNLFVLQKPNIDGMPEHEKMLFRF